MSPVLGQIFLPGLTTPRHENRKILYESKRIRSCCVEMSDLSNDTKKHTMKSRETIPLQVKISSLLILFFVLFLACFLLE
jgi:hypothetical protein